MITTTLNRIRPQRPCEEGWEKLLKYLGKTKADDDPLPFSTILESNGLQDALWCCRVEPQYASEWRLFAVWCARQVVYLMPDLRLFEALDVSGRYALGKASLRELQEAREIAWDVVQDLLEGTVQSVSEEADMNAALAVAEAASEHEEWVAASLAAWSASEAMEGASKGEEWYYARAAARVSQRAEFLRIVTETEARV